MESPDRFNDAVAAEVRAEMGRQRVTITALASSIGWTRPYATARVHGTMALTTDDLESIAGALKVPVSRFTGNGRLAEAAS